MSGDLTTLENVKQWLQISDLPIQTLTNASAAVVTLYNTPVVPLVTGLIVGFEGINGLSGMNGLQLPITVIAANKFSVPFDSTAAGVYTGGGLAGISDQLLSRLISAVSTFIQNFITRNIDLVTYVETRNGLGGRVMTFKNSPCQSVSSVTINGQVIPLRPTLAATTQGTFPPVGYSFDDTRLYLDGYSFCRGNQNINVVYSAGYETTPPDIEQCAIDMIGDWFRYMSRIGKISEGIEGQTITFGQQQISPRALAILNVYNQRAPVY